MSRIDDIRARMRQLERELAQLERFGRDHFVDGDVIRWRKTFPVSRQTPGSMWNASAASELDATARYTYAALKTSAGWYVTGGNKDRSNRSYTFDELVNFITTGPAPEDVEVATAWRDIVTAAVEEKLAADPATSQEISRWSTHRDVTEPPIVK